MGCDGGTIPRRDELVRVKKKPEAKDKDAELAFKWKCCAITQETLQEPIVICHLGKLYSKMSLIEALLDRSTLPEMCRHIKSLKDVKTLNMTKNPEYKNEGKTEGFVALWSCGCVFSERALKEVSTKTCHKCTKPFEDNDVVIINGNEEDLELMKTRMDIRRQKNKKNKEKKVKEEVETKTSHDESAGPSSSESSSKTGKRPSTSVAASSCAQEVKKLKSNGEAALSKIGNVISSGKVTKAEELRKMKPDYSVAKDKHVSDVYKSLFTSHKSEKEQNRAHWVTYNPFYN
nr:unnamed protein product [Callosobruchus analis]